MSPPPSPPASHWPVVASAVFGPALVVAVALLAPSDRTAWPARPAGSAAAPPAPSGPTALGAGGAHGAPAGEAVRDGVREVAGAWTVGKGSKGPPAGALLEGVSRLVDEALAGRFSTDSLREGGTVRVVAKAEVAGGRVVRYLALRALEYTPPEGKAARFFAFTGERGGGFYDERGVAPYDKGWAPPMAVMRRTSKFNPKRLHPILHVVMPHQGTDFGAPVGTPVYAASHGVVTWAGPHGATGTWVGIQHDDGIETGYAHLSKIAPNLRRGDKVKTHQLVGYVGNTGRSTGPHLHFSAKRNGVFFDAETLLVKGERELPAGDRAAFHAERDELAKKLAALEPAAAPDHEIVAGDGAGEAKADEAPAPAGSSSAGRGPSKALRSSRHGG